MATQNVVGLGLLGSTGTGTFVGSTSATLVTPILGVASATSVNFGASATSGIIGVTGGTSAAAGVVGELIQSNIPSGSAVGITTGVAKDLTSISLTAGDWNIFGNVSVDNSTANTLATVYMWINTTSATMPDISLINGISSTTQLLSNFSITIPYVFMNITTTTTVYISAVATFASGPTSMTGNIYARRAR